MTVKPIEMQVLIPKTIDVARLQQIEEHHPEHQQQQFVTELQQRILLQQKQVGNSPRSEKAKIESRGRQERKKQQKNTKEKKDSQQPRQHDLPEDTQTGLGRIIDVKC